jgi:tRNA nucleotidyltransferase (CCA-adding enzyme)
VVVGGSVAEMVELGYRQVGRDFPVFLHPATNEEYALARTERKTGPGHTGFQVHADAAVTLEEDLERRDLTINAIAQAADGSLIDPWEGQADLRARVLRHVSAAFAEDPLRVFRVARFAAQLPGFQVAEETVELIRRMADEGALSELSAERVWAELAKVLDAAESTRFIEVLDQCHALDPWFPEFHSVVPVACPELQEHRQRYAAFVSGLGESGAEALSARVKVPNAHARMAAWLLRHGHSAANWTSAPIDAVYAALEGCRAFKPDGDLEPCVALAAAISGADLTALGSVVAAIGTAVRPADLQRQGLEGADIGRALDAARRKLLDEARLEIFERG